MLIVISSRWVGVDKDLIDEREKWNTFGETTAEGEDALDQRAEHKGFLSAIKIGETAKEEEETARAEGECRDEPLELVL